ncbi:hypothetical protein Sjap_002150 [Stephania japonica]|uniref:BHLH domain-containing protein n=1 Tax=Stephania japonica TaxID=461633 RepID=A0AAP0KM83_9MAGN
MCAFSSLFSTFVWPSIEDQIISTSHNIDHDQYHQNWPSSSPTDDDHQLFMDLDHAQKLSDHDHCTTASDPTKAKRINHNASERDRRKKLNTLYSSLRSLLPASDQSKKLSIPGTVSRVLKYIPELQKQVERLVQRKEELLSSISKQGNDHDVNGNLMMTASKQRKSALKQSFSRVSTSLIDDKEVLVQICALKLKRNQLSEVLLNLEREDLQILNASSFATAGHRVFYTLHFQVNDIKRVECEPLNEKIMYLFERKDLLL